MRDGAPWHSTVLKDRARTEGWEEGEQGDPSPSFCSVPPPGQHCPCGTCIADIFSEGLASPCHRKADLSLGTMRAVERKGKMEDGCAEMAPPSH